MPKKKTTGKLAEGSRVRVKPGVTMPEFPDVSCDGWTGTVAEVSGKGADAKYVIQWDDAVVAQMPESYIQSCKEKQFLHEMAFLNSNDVEAAE